MTIRKIAVIGGGQTGQSIAEAVASAGIGVIIRELTDELASQAYTRLGIELDRRIRKWSITESDKRAILARIQTTSDLIKLKNVDFIIEAIPDNFEAKVDLYGELEDIISSNIIIATNTSALSITELASKTRRPDKFIGVHFLLPVYKTSLVEIVRGFETSDETFTFARNFVEAVNKTSIEVFEYPGYVTTRIILPFINEAMYVVMEGVAAAEDVDIAMKKGYNFPIGPLELADRLRLDHIMNWMETLFHELGDLKYRPCPLLRKMVRAGRLGAWTGKGFFDYDK